MQTISSLLSKSKKHTVFQQAYVVSKFKEAIVDLQKTNYTNLKGDFESLQIFICEKNKSFVIKLKTDCNSFKTFLKTELEQINFKIHNFFDQKGLGQIQFEVLII
jgi:predicted ATP-grasp superfamily ATP-dependent carboligase